MCGAAAVYEIVTRCWNYTQKQGQIQINDRLTLIFKKSLFQGLIASVLVSIFISQTNRGDSLMQLYAPSAEPKGVSCSRPQKPVDQSNLRTEGADLDQNAKAAW